MRLVFDLPLPPSPNDAPFHPMQRVRWKNRTKRAAFAAACSQHPPTANPPERVTVTAAFRLPRYRDEDNLHASLKYVLDALRLPARGESVAWKQGLAEHKGFFAADDPEHMQLAMVVQTEEPSKRRQGLRLCIDGDRIGGNE